MGLSERQRRRWKALARLVVSGLLLGLVFAWVDVGDVWTRLSGLRPGWVVLGLALTVPQVLLLAWRWRFTAARLRVDLPPPAAVAEYYMGIFLNQILPGGIAGDVSRAWRHARGESSYGSAVRAVIIERGSAQVVMTLTALASVAWLPWAATPVRVAAVAAAALVVWVTWRYLSDIAPIDPHVHIDPSPTWLDARAALVTRGAFVPQLASAVLVVASYLAVFVIAARAVGVGAPILVMLPLVAPILMTMLIPVSVAGWGLREAAAAALWGAAGMTPEEGTAVSVAYGLIVLVSATPGLAVLIRAPLPDPDRRGRPPPE